MIPVEVKNCKEYGENRKCLKCEDNYALIGDQCNEIPQGCLKISKDPTSCEVCDNRLKLLGGKCLDVHCGGFSL